MFEDMTYENILSDALSRVTNDVDKREGSVIYDALAPACFFLADMYFKLDNYLDLLFADTAVEMFLDRKAAELGLKRKTATKAVRKVTSKEDLTIGSVWGIEDVSFTILNETAVNEYSAECNTAGSIGNAYSGKLSLISGQKNDVEAQLTDIIVPGSDTESDESLRERYYDRAQLPVTSGNKFHYKQWAKEVPGVGDAKVFPLWNGNGTIKVTIVDSNMEITPGLKDSVQTYIDKVRPIGPTVTVTDPTKTEINITASITTDKTKSKFDIEKKFKAILERDFLELIKKSFDAENSFAKVRLSYAQIGRELLETEGVIDYTLLTVNEGTANIMLEPDAIPIIGTINLTEV